MLRRGSPPPWGRMGGGCKVLPFRGGFRRGSEGLGVGCVTQKSESTETASPHASPRRGGWLSLLRLLPQAQAERSPTNGFQLVPAAKISLKSLSFVEIQPNALPF